MTPKVIIQPVVEPITLEEARLHLRLDTYGSPPEHPDDSLIAMQLSAAREYCEHWLGRALATQTLEVATTCFPDMFVLPMPPVQWIESVTYLDGDGVSQTIDAADYLLDSYTEPSAVSPSDSWPTPKAVVNAVKVRYVAGYTTGNSPDDLPLPRSLRAAILLTLTDLYEQRANAVDGQLYMVPLSAQALMERYRVRLSMA